MSNPNFDRRKVRRAMLAAPAVALIGIIPFMWQLNLTFMQFVLMIVAALIVSYLVGLLFGGSGYLLLKSLGYMQSKYLMIYAALLTMATPLILDDIYALLSLGPATMLAAGAFCFIRGPAIEADRTSAA